MAAQEHSSTRRRVLGAVAALPIAALAGVPAAPVLTTPGAIRGKQSSTAAETWARRLARYRRLHARAKAEAETGAFRAANDRYNQVYAELTARFGTWPKALRSRTGKPLCAAAYARIGAAENDYYHQFTAPMSKAALHLVRTRAPDLDALRAKIEVMREQGFECFEDMPRDPLDVVYEDVRLLTAAGV